MAQRNEKTELLFVAGQARALDIAIRARFWRAVERIRARNADTEPDAVLRDVTEAVEEARRERYQRERDAQGGR